MISGNGKTGGMWLVLHPIRCGAMGHQVKLRPVAAFPSVDSAKQWIANAAHRNNDIVCECSVEYAMPFLEGNKSMMGLEVVDD